MSTFWTTAEQPASAHAPREDMEAVANLLGCSVESLERVGAGRNSRVYKVRAGGAEYAAKFYFRSTADGRDRLQVEFSALQFLWKNGVRSIAQPMRTDPARQLGLYRFIDGMPVSPAEVSLQDIDQLVSFAGELKARSENADARALTPAAEAFFTTSGVLNNVRDRRARLESLDATGHAYEALRGFLREEFTPVFDSLCRREAEDGDGRELDWAHCTLSPSDFGFHNTLRGRDGHLVFLDFEYFGWDDPAKMLSDAVLHPMMTLSDTHKRRLAGGFEKIFGADPGWRERVARLYPLFARKWCMIMLNEFRPDQIERRRYVDRNAEEVHVFQSRQLDAARSLLARTMRQDGGFPYWE
jgi:hypothetical protein